MSTSSSPTTPRRLDHIVLPVAALDIARARYEALGFTVAPDGLHPFGTENCCIFLPDGTFIEPLAVAHRETCEAAALSGNTFVRNDQAYRFRRGGEGFSSLVLATRDAKADDAMFSRFAMDDGPMTAFSRTVALPDGAKGEASFLLAHARDDRAPDAAFFSCEVVKAPKVDRTPLLRHTNGAMGTAGVTLSETNPSDFQYFLQSLFNQREVDCDSFSIALEMENARVEVLTPEGMQGWFGAAIERPERGMRFEAFTVTVADLATTRALLAANGVISDERMGRLVVPPAAGQGCIIAFEEAAR